MTRLVCIPTGKLATAVHLDDSSLGMLSRRSKQQQTDTSPLSSSNNFLRTCRAYLFIDIAKLSRRGNWSLLNSIGNCICDEIKGIRCTKSVSPLQFPVMRTPSTALVLLCKDLITADSLVLGNIEPMEWYICPCTLNVGI